MMNYTVKQLADKLEVTKATITNNAKALDLELKKIDNVIQIDDKQAVLISQRINKNKQANSMINKNPEDVSVSGSQTEEKDSRNDDLVEILKQQIEDLKKDKDEYINQVNNLNGLLKQQQTLLSQQQSLQLQSNEKIKSLEIELKEIKEDNPESEDTHININRSDDYIGNNSKEHSSQVGNFYNELQNKENSGFFRKLFKKVKQ